MQIKHQLDQASQVCLCWGTQFVVAHCSPLDDHSAMPVQSNDVKRAATEGGVNLNKPEVVIDSNELGVFVVRVPDLAPPSQLSLSRFKLWS